MSGHGGWSGQEKRAQHSDSSSLYESYANGEFDQDYDGLVSREIHDKLLADTGFSISTGADYSIVSKQQMARVTDVMSRDFPILKSKDGGEISFAAVPEGKSWAAWAWTGETLRGEKPRVEFGVGRLPRDAEGFKTLMSTERGGFHFPNNTIGATMAHELAHHVEAMTVFARRGSDWDAHNDWNNGTTASEIIKRAARRANLSVSAQLASSPENLAKWAGRHISGYAKHDLHETIAEAVGDCFANGRSASALSRAVYEELKRMSNSYA